ncbi:MAG: sigma-70 family RNA polymerase sigma factor [Lachnospiraceae bacterium]
MFAGISEQYDKLYRYCYFKMHDVQAAEDITQEAFLKLFENSRYKEVKNPLAFLYTVAKNLCIDEYRRKKTVQIPENMLADNCEDKIIESVSLHMALDRLTDREREIILLRFVNEVPVEDIGKIYGISRFAVYREVKKILKKLERRLSYE